jgi:hypothetical protein
MALPYLSAARRAILEMLATVAGSVAVLCAVVIIWAARIIQGRDMYVSELGAAGEPTARWFEGALLLIAVGGSLIAYAARDIRSRVVILATWTPAISIWLGCGFFFIDSQVTCTRGCPLPVGAEFSWQDLIHTVVAVIAFAAACVAMLQISFAEGNRRLGRFSRACGVAVALIAGAGGISSLLNFHTNIGSRLELAATTIALAWLLVLGLVMTGRLRRVVSTSTPATSMAMRAAR